MKIGFAITCYDKFEEANILIELIRKEFKGDYKISLCSNHEKGEEITKNFRIDQYIQGRNIVNIDGDIHKPQNLEKRISIVLRGTDSVLRSCREALNMDVDYIIHMHSDAWCLKEEKILELVNKMKKLEKKLALRSDGFEKLNIRSLAKADDHFFIFEKKYALENKVFQLLPEEQFPHSLTIHEILMLNFCIKYGLRNIWNYRERKSLYNYDRKKVFSQNTLRPVSYDPYYKFLHLHRASFPNEYGKVLQAIYLKENNSGKSEYINDFINKYYRDKNEVLSELEKIEKKYDRILKYCFYSKEIIENREITYKEKLVKEINILTPMKNILKNFLKFGYRKLLKLKGDKEIENIAVFYSEEVKLSKFVEDNWTATLYYDRDIGLEK